MVIPETVTEIKEFAFNYCTDLTSVTIPEGVISIGQYAFACCSSLTSITIPGSITSIGESVFWESGLKSIIYNGTEEQWNALGVDTYGIPVIYNEGSQSGGNQNSALTVENGVVVKCDPEASGFIKIEPGVRAIASDAFNGCSKLEAIVISDGVTSIGGNAFQGCTSLVSVQIPGSVTSVGNGAFEYCHKLSTVNFTGTVGQLAMLELDTKKVDINSVSITCCYGMQNEGICHFASRGDSSSRYVIIPSGTTVIEKDAFKYCKSLKGVVIPGTVKEIEDGAFYGCNLETVWWYNVTLFQLCTEKNNNIYQLKNSKSILLSDGTDLKKSSLVIPDGVTKISVAYFDGGERRAFYGCDWITSVTIPRSVERIGHDAFPSSIEMVRYGGTLAQWCEIYNGGFVKNAKSILLSDGTDLKKLISLTIPNSVTKIGTCAFSGCSRLTSVVIPNSVAFISFRAFSDCNSLVQMSIPDSVTRMGSAPFDGCSSLKNITFLGTKMQWKAIEKIDLPYNTWNYNSGITAVNCSDGTI